MAIYCKLCRIYNKRGFDIVSGIDLQFSAHHATEYTWIFKGGRPLTHHLGISSKEIYFFECLAECFFPKTIFTVGNSFGWSTLALSMLNPAARVVSLELGEDRFTHDWIKRTNEIALDEGLAVKVVKGRSPDDVDSVMKAELAGPIDLAFIDGDHSAPQLIMDVEAIRRNSHNDTVYVIHDVINFGLVDVLGEMAQRMTMHMEILYGTRAGMGVLFSGIPPRGAVECCSDFGSTDSANALVRYFQSRPNLTGEQSLIAVADCVRDCCEP